jgi:transcriptional regulator NrdR family protein
MFKFISKIDEKAFEKYQENILNFLASNNSKEFESKHVAEMVLKKIISTYKSKKQ